ncbi:hypothetical protein Pint_14669 [Pistacia integerrima]|uniref:Uncharacterized protein n=1 Tax=Pistacia integerrima TaxID=434235 RepID=A0ACC0Y998_9ROSI|nr:hypothetical protein Pint_14669 [Pistacia integerrima]
MNNISRALPISSRQKSIVTTLLSPEWTKCKESIHIGQQSELFNSIFNDLNNMGRLLDEWRATITSMHETLVSRVPYHGYAWSLANPNDKAIGAPASGPAVTIDVSIGYKIIRALIQNYVFTSGATWINFDGVETIRAKIAYAKEKKLLGYNAFQLSNNDNWALSMADSSTYQLSIPCANEQYFSSFIGTIRGKSPSVTTLLSVWNGQNATGQSILGNKVNYLVLSSMVSDSSHRKSFIESSMKTAASVMDFKGLICSAVA